MCLMCAMHCPIYCEDATVKGAILVLRARRHESIHAGSGVCRWFWCVSLLRANETQQGPREGRDA